MPVLNWIGREAVVKHHKDVPLRLTRKEINQADGYTQRIAASAAMSGSPFICTWVVGQEIAACVERDKQLGNLAYERVGAAIFGSPVDTARCASAEAAHCAGGSLRRFIDG